MLYLALKAVHLVGVVSWFAGLFYLVRLFVYHAEALAGPEPARGILDRQYQVMEGRLARIIMTPAMVVTVVAALGMVVADPRLLREGWLHVKLLLVLVLLAYHAWCVRTVRGFAAGTVSTGGHAFRIANEAPTLLLVAITLLAVFRGALSGRVLAGVVLVLAVLLGAGIRIYAKRRRVGG